MSCTVVTAFYSIRSKFPKDQYLTWGEQFMSLTSPIVIFTEEHLVDILVSMRGDRPIHVVVLPFQELETWKGDMAEKWAHQHTLNPEGHHFTDVGEHRLQQTPELYALWAHKAYFVERAIHINPFQTDYFFWCDFGAFRDPIPTEIRERFPESRLLPRNKIILQALVSVSMEEKEPGSDGIRGPRLSHEWNGVRLVGGLWGGGKEACLAWKKAFDRMLHRYLQAGRYAGNDQFVMLSTLLEDPELAMVVKPTRADINQWFFLEYLLSSLAEMKIDIMYM
jgi:hypothetical protein